MLSEQEPRPLIEQALGALAEMDISHEDTKPDDFILTGETADKVVVVDLERIDGISALFGYTREGIVREAVDYLMRRYREQLRCLGVDGTLQPQPARRT